MNIDRYKVRLTIHHIEYRGENHDIKNYVMEPSPDLHCGCPILVDENGIDYPVESIEKAIISNNKQGKTVEYAVEFHPSSDPGFPIGKHFYIKPEKWKKPIPDSELVEIICKSQGRIPLTRQLFKKTTVRVNNSGKVFVLQEETLHRPNDETNVFFIDKGEAKKLLKDMLRCVAKNDCYCNDRSDDTVRYITFVFANGQSSRYCGTYAHGEIGLDYIDTTQLMEEFLREPLI